MNVNAYNHKHSGCFKARNTSTIIQNERKSAIQIGTKEKKKKVRITRMKKKRIYFSFIETEKCIHTL